MLRRMLRSKIHRATVTRIDLDYEGSITVDVVLAHADLALYQAKISGRDAYCVYRPGLKT